MGVALKDLIQGEEIALQDLKDKTVVIDASNILYQFLTTIRARDGELFTDSKGRITSHLIGLLSRMVNFLHVGIKPVFVFDGKPPSLKQKERERRIGIKKEAKAKYEIALKEENIQSMKKFAARTTKLTPEMVESSKKLLGALGIPYVQAPSEAEAQAAFIVKEGNAYASVSQDFDSLLFGCPLLVRNLSVAGRRKKIHGLGTIAIKPEIIRLSSVLNELGIDQDGLIALGMLIGTDYDIGGIKGIGPKNALKLVRQYNGDIDEMFKQLKWDEYFSFPWTDVFYLFKKMPVKKTFKFKWKSVNKEKLAKLLKSYDFSDERITSALEKLKKHETKKQQKGLGDFI